MTRLKQIKLNIIQIDKQLKFLHYQLKNWVGTNRIQDLVYKPGVAARTTFEYSPLGKALKKGLKKDDKVSKVVKYDNDLVYDSVHNFNKYSVSNFNETTSVDSKFNTLNKFYKDFKKLEGVKSRTNERKQKRITVLKNKSFLYDQLISIYKK